MLAIEIHLGTWYLLPEKNDFYSRFGHWSWLCFTIVWMRP